MKLKSLTLHLYNSTNPSSQTELIKEFMKAFS